MIFFPGLHHPSDAKRFDRCFVSVNALRGRKSDFEVKDWIMDSGAFSLILKHGKYPDSIDAYVQQIKRWVKCGNMLAAVSQDYMCEDDMLLRTGLTKADHQRLTIERYDAIKAGVGGTVYVLPVLQGYEPEEYVCHMRQYGSRLAQGQWVGVGSVCKRNVDLDAIERVLMAIKQERPDLLLHGFGVKTTALRSSIVRECLKTADSMAWSKAARLRGRNPNDWREAEEFVRNIEAQKVKQRHFQPLLF